MKCFVLLGRILFSCFFLAKALHHFTGEVMTRSIEAGAPIPGVLVPVSGILLLLGAVSILLGYKARVGAWFLIIELLPATLILHRFWEVREGHIVFLQTYCFLKNISLIGACLMIAYFGSGPFSLSKQPKK